MIIVMTIIMIRIRSRTITSITTIISGLKETFELRERERERERESIQ